MRTLDLGPSQLFLRASSRVILAAEAVGEIGRPDREQLDAGFLEFVDRHDRGAPVAEADLAALAAHIVQPPARSGKSGRAKWIVIGLLVALGLAAALAGRSSAGAGAPRSRRPIAARCAPIPNFPSIR